MSDETLTVIPLNVFRGFADAFQPRGLFAEKAAWLRETFRCFNESAAAPPPHHASGARREYREHRGDRGDRSDRSDRAGAFGGGGGGGRYRYGDGPRDRGPPSGLRRPVGFGHAPGGAASAGPPAEKPRIGNREFSLENVARKDFLGVLNKLSAANCATLIANFAKVLRPEFADLYVKLFWEGFLRSADYQPVQIRLLPLFNEHFPVQPRVAALLDEYRAQRLWMPAEGLLPPDGPADAASASADYDDFCDYVKWRKKTVNTIHAWRVLAENAWVPADALGDLMARVLSDFQRTLPDLPRTAKLAETLAEQLFVYAKSLGSAEALGPETLAALRALPAETFPPALRFKIYDIREFLSAAPAPTRAR